ncbi:phage major capsid protein [Pediococcus acidilactici]|uniref:phage major capsid protein n=1 Tax=Pediococcus acidilactici TaxID=1254 RepID=UPI00233050F5|nr:phage major capsid protein [Pediococcus acidilactici]MDB8867675.1 phage major capsid protein [Pediococcus acidilactici]
MPNINKINDAWIASGQKVADLDAKISAALLDDKFDKKAFADLKDERDTEVARRDSLKEQLDVERKAQEVVNMKPENVTPLNADEEDIKNKFVKDFKDMIRHDPRMNAITSATGDDGSAAGLTIPEDVQTAIHSLVRQYASLQQYVNVEKVTTNKGSRVYEKWSDITPLTNLDDESAKIGDNDDPKLAVVKYVIKRFAGISTATNSLLKDTAENVLTWLTSWIAKKVVVTRNQAILGAMNAVPKKATLANFDDIKHMANTAVDPAIRATSIFLTNTSGFDILTKVKDVEGRYLMQPSVTNPEVYMIGGRPVIEIADRWLPDVGTKDAPAHPLYFGDLKQAVTLFDRENMSLYTTDVGGGAFETDTTKIRVIDRFDVQPTDTEAFVAGSFTTIADQTAPATASK